MEDRISDLPDAIFVIVLSFLTIRDAARTSVLSRRWRDLWKFVDKLNFDNVNRLGRFRHDMRKEKFVQWVNHVMDLYQGSSLRQLKIHFPLHVGFSKHINRWVSFALSKNVSHLELNLLFLCGPYHRDAHDYPSFNVKEASTSLQHMSLTACRLNHSSLDKFKSLTSLSLTSGYVTDEILGDFVSNCLFLENLSVLYSNDLVYPRIVGSSLKLKSLEICHCVSLKGIDIYAMDLKSLKYFGPKICFNLQCIPRLVEVTLGVYGDTCTDRVDYALSQLTINFLRLETIVLEVSTNEVQVTSFPTLSNLKVLILLVDGTRKNFLAFTSLLRASPSLHRFGLHMEHCKKPEARETEEHSVGFPLKFLKDVEVVGFRGYQNDFELLSFLLRNAITMEKITLDPHDKFWDGQQRMDLNQHELRAVRDRARQFRDRVNPCIEVVIL